MVQSDLTKCYFAGGLGLSYKNARHDQFATLVKDGRIEVQRPAHALSHVERVERLEESIASLGESVQRLGSSVERIENSVTRLESSIERLATSLHGSPAVINSGTDATGLIQQLLPEIERIFGESCRKAAIPLLTGNTQIRSAIQPTVGFNAEGAHISRVDPSYHSANGSEMAEGNSTAHPRPRPEATQAIVQSTQLHSAHHSGNSPVSTAKAELPPGTFTTGEVGISDTDFDWYPANDTERAEGEHVHLGRRPQVLPVLVPPIHTRSTRFNGQTQVPATAACLPGERSIRGFDSEWQTNETETMESSPARSHIEPPSPMPPMPAPSVQPSSTYYPGPLSAHGNSSRVLQSALLSKAVLRSPPTPNNPLSEGASGGPTAKRDSGVRRRSSHSLEARFQSTIISCASTMTPTAPTPRPDQARTGYRLPGSSMLAPVAASAFSNSGFSLLAQALREAQPVTVAPATGFTCSPDAVVSCLPKRSLVGPLSAPMVPKKTGIDINTRPQQR